MSRKKKGSVPVAPPKQEKREYERGKEPGRYRDDIGSGSFGIACFVVE